MGEHFLSSDAFLRTVADVYFPGARPEHVRCGDFETKALIHRGRPVSGFFWFSVPHFPVPHYGRARRVPYLQRALLRTEQIAGIPPPDGLIEVAPFISWREFATWADFVAFARARGARTGSLERDEERLTRAFGEVRFLPDDPDQEALRLALVWKAEHYARTGFPRLHTVQDRQIYHELRRRGLMGVSSLRAGDRKVAAALWHLHEGTFIFRLTAYDRTLATYSPGAIHFHHLLRHRFEAGDKEFDMLVGREAFKYHYATHARFLGRLGTEPRLDRWRRRARMRAGLIVARYPGLQVRVRRVEAAANRAIARLRR